MNKKSIRQLRKKFIFVAMVSVAIVMLLLAILINGINYLSIRSEIHDTLSFISDAGGDINAVPKSNSSKQSAVSKTAEASVAGSTGISRGTVSDSAKDSSSANDASESSSAYSTDESKSASASDSVKSASESADAADTADNPTDKVGAAATATVDDSPEFRYATRYFAVTLDSSGNPVSFNLDHIAAIDENDAIVLAKVAINRFFKFGSYGDYYYEVTDLDDGGKLVVYLDSTQLIRSYYRLFYGTIIICIAGLMIVFIFIYFLSNRLIQPEIENVEKQKEFITNASHELKTPLAVIRANTELGEMMNGPTEWTQSTLKQVERLDGLVANLVTLTRANEQEDKSVLTNVNLTDIVNESADTFESVAVKEHKTLNRKLQPDVTMLTDGNAIQMLTGLLLDNAIKYCDDGGTVLIELTKKGKAATLAVSNTYAEGKNTDFSRFFDRFYRKDEAHNVEKGGYGIGLSIAQNIVQRFRGGISASWKNDMITFTCVLF